MTNLTLNDYLNYFKSLDFKGKVKVLSELTSILNQDVSGSTTRASAESRMTDAECIDDLFGVWKDEDGLTEAAIINRTSSSREIDLN